MFNKIAVFWREREGLIFSVVFLDYILLTLWEYLIPGMVFEIFNPQWLLLVTALFLIIRLSRKDLKKTLDFSFPFWQSWPGMALLLVLLFLIFINWLAVGLWTAIIFSLVSLLSLKYLADFLLEDGTMGDFE